jgi:hypothetical protein
MAKFTFLESLDEAQLKKIAKAENLPVPKDYDKDELVKYLQGTLSIERSKKYEKMYSEKVVERDIHIHERIKEKSIQAKSEDEERVSISREGKILKLMKVTIQKEVLSALANKLHEKEPEGSKQNLLEEMSDDFLNRVYEIFVDLKHDRNGRNFEYLCSNYLMKNWKGDIEKLELDHEFHGVGEIDVVGFDRFMLPIGIAECKDKTTLKEDIDKWITNTKSLYEQFSQKIQDKHKQYLHMNSYFFSSERITQEVLARYKNHKISERGVYQKIPLISPKVYFWIYEVKGDKFEQKFPK